MTLFEYRLPRFANGILRPIFISRSVKYCHSIMLGEVRYDKDGQLHGAVTKSDVADTLKRIQKRAKCAS